MPIAGVAYRIPSPCVGSASASRNVTQQFTRCAVRRPTASKFWFMPHRCGPKRTAQSSPITSLKRLCASCCHRWRCEGTGPRRELPHKPPPCAPTSRSFAHISSVHPDGNLGYLQRRIGVVPTSALRRPFTRRRRSRAAATAVAKHRQLGSFVARGSIITTHRRARRIPGRWSGKTNSQRPTPPARRVRML
jgi:hypothetical protein